MGSEASTRRSFASPRRTRRSRSPRRSSRPSLRRSTTSWMLYGVSRRGRQSATTSRRSPMPTSVTMPQLGETVVEGTITKWLKKEGDRIERDEPLFEISTDKVDTEVPSPVAGTIAKLLVAEGETVSVGTELAQ